MSEIFPIVFYEESAEGTSPAFVNFDFQGALIESGHVNNKWPGQACAVNSQDFSCAFSPYDFQIVALPAYVFLQRINNNKQAVLIKKIEGKELSKAELLAEIEDAANAEYTIGKNAVSVDLDGDGTKEQIFSSDKASIGLGFGSPLGSLFDCERFLPRGLCRFKLGYLLLLIMLIAIIGFVVRR